MDILLLAAIVPAAVLLWYVYKADPIEKEPGELLTRLLGWGAVSCIPAVILESVGGNVLISGFGASGIPALVVENFVVVALSEELCKFFFLRWKTWRHSAFDYVFDGIVYGVFVSLGFAILENIGYVAEYGMATAVVRAFTAIPGHAIFGVFMGCFYGLAKRADASGQAGKRRALMVAALVVPILCHGFYDFCASIDDAMADLVFFAFLFLIMFVAMRLVKYMAASAHPVYDPGYASGVQPGAYDPIVDNSLDGAQQTYVGPNQYGGTTQRDFPPLPPESYPTDRRGPQN